MESPEPIDPGKYTTYNIIGMILGLPGLHNIFLARSAPNIDSRKNFKIKGAVQLAIGSPLIYFVVYWFLHLIISSIIMAVLSFTIVLPFVYGIIDFILWIIVSVLWVCWIPVYIWCIYEAVTAQKIVEQANTV